MRNEAFTLNLIAYCYCCLSHCVCTEQQKQKILSQIKMCIQLAFRHLVNSIKIIWFNTIHSHRCAFEPQLILTKQFFSLFILCWSFRGYPNCQPGEFRSIDWWVVKMLKIIFRKFVCKFRNSFVCFRSFVPCSGWFGRFICFFHFFDAASHFTLKCFLRPKLVNKSNGNGYLNSFHVYWGAFDEMKHLRIGGQPFFFSCWKNA